MKKNGGFVPSVNEIRRVDGNNGLDEKAAMNLYMNNADVRNRVDVLHPLAQREQILDNRERHALANERHAIARIADARNQVMLQRMELERKQRMQHHLNAKNQELQQKLNAERQRQVNNFLGVRHIVQPIVRPIAPIVRLSPYDYRDALQRYHDRKIIKDELRRELLNEQPKPIIVKVVRKPAVKKQPAKKPVKKPVKADNKAKKPAKKSAKQ